MKIWMQSNDFFLNCANFFQQKLKEMVAPSCSDMKTLFFVPFLMFFIKAFCKVGKNMYLCGNLKIQSSYDEKKHSFCPSYCMGSNGLGHTRAESMAYTPAE